MNNLAEKHEMEKDDYLFMLEMEKMKKDIDTIRNVSLPKMERDIDDINKKVDKIDARIWWILGLLVTSMIISTIANYFAG